MGRDLERGHLLSGLVEFREVEGVWESFEAVRYQTKHLVSGCKSRDHSSGGHKSHL